MKTLSFIGGRPNLIKSETIHKALTEMGVSHDLIDIGVYLKSYGKQSYDELGLPEPKAIFNVRSGLEEYINSTKELAKRIKKYIDISRPSLIFVYGDLNPGVACAIAASQSKVLLVHVEAGMRNFDFNDTEEINRIILDKFANILFTSDNIAKTNLLNERFSNRNVFLTGNTIIDTLRRHLPFSDNSIVNDLCLNPRKYGLITIHREENLESPSRLSEIINAIELLRQWTNLVMIQYSSTVQALYRHRIQVTNDLTNIKVVDTLPYHQYLGLLRNASFVFTDSSGLQDESTFLGIPCFTCRNNTHRIGTLLHGSNKSVPANAAAIFDIVTNFFDHSEEIDKKYPEEWNIDATKSIAEVMKIIIERV